MNLKKKKNVPSAKNDARPELFFGFVGALGADLKGIINIFKEELRAVEYHTEEIRLSDLLQQFGPSLGVECPAAEATEEKRIDGLMDAGNQFRETLKRGDALAMLAATAVQEHRSKHDANSHLDDEDAKSTAIPSCAYIFHQIKHPDEVKTLREIYGKNFFLISAYSPREKRKKLLLERIKKSHGVARVTPELDSEAERLIEKDLKQEGLKFGQSVRDAFHLGAFFIEDAEERIVQAQVKRFIQLLFNYPFITPTQLEYFMFMASAAALRSADLSRQVGAVIASQNGDIISTGCNEVPIAGGGAYWDGDEPNFDNRDYKKGFDANVRLKTENVTEFLQLLNDNRLLSIKDEEIHEAAQQALFGEKAFLKNSGMANVIEYGRIVHAEMTAVTEAARKGVSIKDAILYCTTFPCHMCARHILASGVKKVYYIEPYPKSLTSVLYEEDVAVDGEINSARKVVEFKPFVGVSPRIYFAFFQMPKRKNKNGDKMEWDAKNALPKVPAPNMSLYMNLESAGIERFLTLIEELKGHESTK